MNLQSFIIAIATLVAPMIVITQSQEMFGKYPYCTECEANFKDAEGVWFYSHSEDSWCKVDENKCQGISCGAIKGFPCCNDPSTTVSYTDADGEWGVEKKKWCLVESLNELDFGIELKAWLNAMPSTNENDNVATRPATFSFTINDISLEDFKENYEIQFIELNGKPIHNNQVDYNGRYGFRFNSLNYKNTNNNIQLKLKNNKTNKKYIKELLNFNVNIVM